LGKEAKIAQAKIQEPKIKVGVAPWLN
jgi:hypothetical protein